MNRFQRRAVSLLAILFLVSCSTTGQVGKAPQYKFSGLTLAKDVDRSGEIGVPVEPTSEFTTQDDKVVAILNFQNISGKKALRWEWYDPQGKLYYATDGYYVTSEEGKYHKEATVWHAIKMNGDKAEQFTGPWEVKVYMNDKLIKSAKFMVKTGVADLEVLPASAQRPYPKDWGLVIGIENYASLPKVEYAKKDALIVREYFEKVLGVPEENIILLTDQDATKGRIEGFLKQYLPSNLDRDATLYVYYAGHGAPDIQKGEPYLVPYDGDTRFIEQTGYKLKTFYDDLDALKIGRVFVFLDSCFSGVASRAAEMLTKGSRPALVHVQDVSIQSAKVISISASNAGQTSNAYPETEHGLFTYYMLRALRGEADANDDRWVSVKEAYDYVKKHVNREARKMGAEQTPVITPSLDKIKDLAISRSIK